MLQRTALVNSEGHVLFAELCTVFVIFHLIDTLHSKYETQDNLPSVTN